ncbi:MAG TPA: TfoX/Sxy family protein [Burkholderiaceae bacterium]|nr:TfoX/Sxy family protein [Burkholderiaceae bacterium]
MSVSKDFADYCCELLSGVGKPTAKRMFGGFAVYVEDVSIAWLLDLNKDNNAKLFLKASDDTRAQYEDAGCQRFVYDMKGVPKSVNYYAAPDDAMESPDAMLPWARMALRCALEAKATAKPKAKTIAKPTAKLKTTTQPKSKVVAKSTSKSKTK